jgi:hypothetical protein
MLVAAGLLHSVFGQRDAYTRGIFYNMHKRIIQVNEIFKVQSRFFLHLLLFSFIIENAPVVLNLNEL